MSNITPPSLRDTLPSLVPEWSESGATPISELVPTAPDAKADAQSEAEGSQDTILVADAFSPNPPHGEWVSFVAQRSSRLDNAHQIGNLVVPNNAHNEAQFIDAFDKALGKADDSDTHARVINISSGRSPARAAYELAGHLLKWPDSLDAARTALSQEDATADLALATAAVDQAESLIQYFGLDKEASAEEILRKVVDEVEATFSSDEVKAACSDLGDTLTSLHDKGISVVVSAGNYQEVATRLDERGVDYDKDTFLDNTLVQGPAISVGATTHSALDFFLKGKWPQVEPAPFSNVSGETDIAADGTDITVAVSDNPDDTVTQSGTSFAAPQVAALLADLYEVNPDLSPDEALDIIQDTAIAPRDEDVRQLGAGLIMPKAAIDEARARHEN